MIFDKVFNKEKFEEKYVSPSKKTRKTPISLRKIWKGVKKVMENFKFTKEEEKAILDYLDKQIERVDETIGDLRGRIDKAPDDEYSKNKLREQFHLRDELVSMKRELRIKE